MMPSNESPLLEIYAPANRGEAYVIKDYLEREGVRVRIVGDVFESAGGELPRGPRLWVMQSDADRAQELIERWHAERETRRTSSAQAAPWICSQCGTEVEGEFEVCWQCEHPREQELPGS